jgi:DNA polymerase delta subunit 3
MLLQRRTGARPLPAAPKPKFEASVPTKRPLQKEEALAKPTPKTEEQPQPTSGSESQSSAKPAVKAPAPKREKSNLFNSFAKAKPKQKTATPTESVRVTYALYLVKFFWLTLIIDKPGWSVY